MSSNPQTYIKVIQCNIARSQNCLKEVINVCINEDIDIALIQEPYTSNTGFVKTNSNIKVFQRKGTEDVKAAILVFNPNINLLLQTQHSDSHIATADVKLGNLIFRLTSVYNPPYTDISPILQRLSQAYHNISRGIIGGDVNAAHTSWTSNQRQDANGNKIFDFAIIKDFEIINTGRTPTFETIRGNTHLKSIIDITLASN
jgi:hypothetical protein